MLTEGQRQTSMPVKRGVLYRCELIDEKGKRPAARKRGSLAGAGSEWMRVFVEIRDEWLVTWPAGGRQLEDIDADLGGCVADADAGRSSAAVSIGSKDGSKSKGDSKSGSKSGGDANVTGGVETIVTNTANSTLTTSLTLHPDANANANAVPARDYLDRVPLRWAHFQDFKFPCGASGLVVHFAKGLQRLGLKLPPDQGLSTLQEWRGAVRRAAGTIRGAAIDRTAALLKGAAGDSDWDAAALEGWRVRVSFWWPGQHVDTWETADLSIEPVSGDARGEQLLATQRCLMLRGCEKGRRLACIGHVTAAYALGPSSVPAVVIEGRAQWLATRRDSRRLPVVDKVAVVPDEGDGALCALLARVRDAFEIVYPRLQRTHTHALAVPDIESRVIAIAGADAPRDFGKWVAAELVESRPWARTPVMALFGAYRALLPVPDAKFPVEVWGFAQQLLLLGYCLKRSGVRDEDQVVSSEQFELLKPKGERELADMFWCHVALKPQTE